MQAGKTGIYHFRDFALETQNYCLIRSGQQIHLRPKNFETLLGCLKMKFLDSG